MATEPWTISHKGILGSIGQRFWFWAPNFGSYYTKALWKKVWILKNESRPITIMAIGYIDVNIIIVTQKTRKPFLVFV